MFWHPRYSAFVEGPSQGGEGSSGGSPQEEVRAAEPGVDSGKFTRDVAQAASAMLVLGLIAKAPEPTHGYEIARQISASAPAGFSIKHGTLYPLLRSLEAEGLIQSATMPSSEGPPRRVLWATPHGRATLRAWRASWSGVQGWVAGLLDAGGAMQSHSGGATS